MPTTFHFEELDHETRDYLHMAREQNGKGMPGIFCPKSNNLPVIGMIVGFVIIIATVIVTFPPTLPPTKEALLQTAGFLLGGWMIVAAMRVWMSGKSGKYGGHFIYADPDNLYVGKGGVVEITDLYELRDAKAVQNFNEGKYTGTDITLKVGKRRTTVHVKDEERGRRLTVYLNAVCYMRDGGEDGKDEDLRKLSSEAMGVIAKEVAKTGEFPSNIRRAEEAEVTRVARPKKDGRRSLGIFAILATILVGVGLFFSFRAINPPLRDHAVFSQIKSLDAKQQPYALRVYLMNPDFTAHRDEAQRMLDGHYDNAVRNHINGSDADLKKAMSDVVLALKNKPQPVISFVCAEEQAPPGQEIKTSAREGQVQKDLADKWGATIGDELVVFAAPADPDNPSAVDKKSKGMIDLRWRFADNATIEYTIEFRLSPDEAPIISKKLVVTPEDGGAAAMKEPERSNRMNEALIEDVIKKTLGTTRPRQLQQPVDF